MICWWGSGERHDELAPLVLNLAPPVAERADPAQIHRLRDDQPVRSERRRLAYYALAGESLPHGVAVTLEPVRPQRERTAAIRRGEKRYRIGQVGDQVLGERARHVAVQRESGHVIVGDGDVAEAVGDRPDRRVPRGRRTLPAEGGEPRAVLHPRVHPVGDEPTLGGVEVARVANRGAHDRIGLEGARRHGGDQVDCRAAHASFAPRALDQPGIGGDALGTQVFEAYQRHQLFCCGLRRMSILS